MWFFRCGFCFVCCGYGVVWWNVNFKFNMVVVWKVFLEVGYVIKIGFKDMFYYKIDVKIVILVFIYC